MIVKNKKNGTNVLAYKVGIQNVRVIIRAGEQINIGDLKDFNQIINKADFLNSRGWFEIVNESKEVAEEVRVEEAKEENKEETSFEKAKKEVKEYTSKNKKKTNN